MVADLPGLISIDRVVFNKLEIASSQGTVHGCVEHMRCIKQVPAKTLDVKTSHFNEGRLDELQLLEEWDEMSGVLAVDVLQWTM